MDACCQLFFVFGSGVPSFLLDNTPYILNEVWGVGWPVKHRDGMSIKPGFGVSGGMGRGQVLFEDEIFISIQFLSRRNHKVL